MTERRGAAVVAAAFAILALASFVGPVAAQESGRWTAWLGCWEPAAERLGPAEVDNAPRLCIESAGAGVRVIASAQDQPSAERVLIADGQRHDLSMGGCTGWESATWSAYGARLYVDSRLECEGVERNVSGVMAMLPGGEWLDIRAVKPGAAGAVRVVRYRAASEPSMDRALAVETARAAAAAPLTPQEVVEAVERTQPEVVEALLLERGDGFDLDGATLSMLADRGVPGDVIDVMVALSYPDRFSIDRQAGMVAEAETARSDRTRDRDYDPFFGYGYGWYDPFFYSGYSRYGYRYGYSPYRLGYGYGYGWYDRPIIIVRGGGSNDDFEPRNRGRRVRGMGYTGSDDDRGGTAQPRGGSTERVRAGSTTSGSTGSATSSGSGSSSSTGRKAKPRGSGG